MRGRQPRVPAPGPGVPRASGPPWIHSSRGAGRVAPTALAGSTSQARSGVPSSAVAVTSSSRPGQRRRRRRAEQRLRLLVRRAPGRAGPGAGGRVDGGPQRVHALAVRGHCRRRCRRRRRRSAGWRCRSSVDPRTAGSGRRRRPVTTAPRRPASTPAAVGQRSQPRSAPRLHRLAAVGGQVQHGEPESAGLVRACAGVCTQHRDPRAVRGDSGGQRTRGPGRRQQRAALAGRRRRSPPRVSRSEPPASADCQLTTTVRPSGVTSQRRLVVQRPADVPGEVAQLDQPAHRRRRSASSAAIGVADEQPRLVRAEVVVPVPDRVGLVQDRRDLARPCAPCGAWRRPRR